MDEKRPVLGAGDDEAQLGRDDDACDGVLVASQDSSGGRDLRGNIIWRCLMARRGEEDKLIVILTSVIGTDTT